MTRVPKRELLEVPEVFTLPYLLYRTYSYLRYRPVGPGAPARLDWLPAADGLVPSTACAGKPDLACSSSLIKPLLDYEV